MIIEKIQVTGTSVTTAEMEFSPNCNIISGASDTGKSFLFGCLQYMFGSDKPPKQIPFATGYERIVLFMRSNGRSIRLERSIRGGDFILDAGNGQLSVDRTDINDFFLDEIKIGKKRIRKNQSNETVGLSFSHLRQYFFIDEVSIVDERSPVISGNTIMATIEQSVFRLLITGKDDSDLVKVDPPKILSAKKAGSASAASAIVEKLNSRLSGSSQNVEEEIARCEKRISVLMDRLSVVDGESTTLVKEKQDLFRNLEEINAHGVDITGTLGRFQLLSEAYNKDIDRLSFVEESNHILGQVPAGKCPTCGQEMDHVHESETESVDLFSGDIFQALQVEKTKIISLKEDLSETIENLTEEKNRLKSERLGVNIRIEAIDQMIKENISKISTSIRNELDDVISERDQYLEQKLIERHIDQIENAILDLYPKVSKKKDTSKKISFSETDAVFHLEEQIKLIVKEIFKAEKSIKFDGVNWDIVIDGQARGSFGKGLRSIYRAIFYAGLMNLCLKGNRPHSGFLVIDSPLTTHEESDDHPIEEGVQAAFWNYFANVNNAQIIIFENKEPEFPIQQAVSYRRFNGVKDNEGCGFIPPRKDF